MIYGPKMTLREARGIVFGLNVLGLEGGAGERGEG